MLFKAAKTFITLAGCIITLAAFSQGDDGTGFIFNDPQDTIVRDTLVFDIDKDISEQILPLDTLLELAYINSPAVKFEDAMIETKVWNYRYTRVLFFQGVSAFYNYAVGNQTLIVTGSSPIDNSQLSNGYRLGFNIQIPLSTVLGQGKKNKQMRAEIDAARHRRDQVKQDVRREIQRIYVNMIEAQRKLRIRTDDAQASLFAFRVAEVELEEGKIPPAEFARIRNIYAISQSNLENERAMFLRAFYDFEALMGVEMKYLKRPVEKKIQTPKK